MSFRRTAETFANWLVGPNLQEYLGTNYLRKLSRREHGFARLANCQRHRRRCFVIGNGPSLKGMDLRPLADEFTIATNSFYKHPDAGAIGLDFLCIFDRHFMQDEPRSVDWHRTIENRLPGTSLVLHHSGRPLVAAHGLYANRDVYYARSGYQTKRSEWVDLDFTKPRNVGMTTGSSIAIPLALYLGFTEIYLVGFDCNWLVDTGASYHFYDTHEQYPEFDSVANDNRGISYESFLRIIFREFESHRLLREKAESLGARIVNATAGGLLDVYERADYNDCLIRRQTL